MSDTRMSRIDVSLYRCIRFETKHNIACIMCVDITFIYDKFGFMSDVLNEIKDYVRSSVTLGGL